MALPFIPSGPVDILCFDKADADMLVPRMARHMSQTICSIDLEGTDNVQPGHLPYKLISIATDDGLITSIRSSVIEDDETSKDLVLAFLSSDIMKMGAAIGQDCRILVSAHNLYIPNIVELALLARTVDPECHYHKYSHPIGLDSMTRYFLKFFLQGKGPGGTQTSNWSADALSEDQIRYAALDVRAGLELGIHLLKIIQKDPCWTQKRPYFSFDCGHHQHITSSIKLLPGGSHLLPVHERQAWKAFNPFYPPVPTVICPVCQVERDYYSHAQHQLSCSAKKSREMHTMITMLGADESYHASVDELFAMVPALDV